MAYKIAIIVGSLRQDSINRKVARSICALRDDNLDCSVIEIGDLPLYNQDLDQDPPEQWRRFRQQIAEADGVLFCSPEYNRGIPGVLKNAIDVGSRPYGQSVFEEAGSDRHRFAGQRRWLRRKPSDPPSRRIPQHADHAAARGLFRPCVGRQLRPNRLP
jgi:NAD(P)H-dependent FMN reductase